MFARKDGGRKNNRARAKVVGVGRGVGRCKLKDSSPVGKRRMRKGKRARLKRMQQRAVAQLNMLVRMYGPHIVTTGHSARASKKRRT